MRRLVIVTAIPVLGVIAGIIFNAFVPQPYQATTVVRLGPGGIGPGLKPVRRRAIPRSCMPTASSASTTSWRCGASSSLAGCQETW